MRLVTFSWAYEGEEVFLCGSWSDWKNLLLLRKVSGREETIFSAVVSLEPGIYLYKYFVDGEWKIDKNALAVFQQNGEICNCLCNPDSLVQEDALLQTLPTREKVCSSSDKPELPARLGNPISPRPGHRNAFAAGEGRMAVIMVGLPARGKSFISAKVARYLKWLGYETNVFNVGAYRRKRLGSYHQHDFFRSDNPEGVKIRLELCRHALDDLLSFLSSGGHVGILDATNHTRPRRRFIVDYLKGYKEGHVKLMFVEVICDMASIIDRNIQLKAHNSADYTEVDPKFAEEDFRERLKHYEKSYETITEKQLSFFKLFNVGERTVTNRIQGILPTRIVYYLMNLHIVPRPLYFSLQENTYSKTSPDVENKTSLSSKGSMAEFMSSSQLPRAALDPAEHLSVWCSPEADAVEIAQKIPHVELVSWKALEEIDMGECAGMSAEEFKACRPRDFKQMQMDPLHYRFPGIGGESYSDLIARLEPVIIELERQRSPVIAHKSVLQCLLAYFMNMEPVTIPSVNIPLHQIIKVEPANDGLNLEHFPLKFC
ncbi:6-phosphofructo-2-kinase/fructose-2,6-bisphosphatase-like isoform X2 [Zophobas morio]|uniref:6-phosphofructo-2-kinase/fructose-2, 6-bisphosphatase-like isoform X2 n=1 Tax=Zophobas morio TaxID=2755281 RepID=UPI0030830E38